MSDWSRWQFIEASLELVHAINNAMGEPKLSSVGEGRLHLSPSQLDVIPSTVVEYWGRTIAHNRGSAPHGGYTLIESGAKASLVINASGRAQIVIGECAIAKFVDSSKTVCRAINSAAIVVRLR